MMDRRAFYLAVLLLGLTSAAARESDLHPNGVNVAIVASDRSPMLNFYGDGSDNPYQISDSQEGSFIAIPEPAGLTVCGLVLLLAAQRFLSRRR